MLKQVYDVDSNGYIKNIYVEESDSTRYIKVDPPNGLYRPRWNGTEWVEDMEQSEIDELYNQPKQPTAEERVTELENTILAILEVL